MEAMLVMETAVKISRTLPYSAGVISGSFRDFFNLGVVYTKLGQFRKVEIAFNERQRDWDMH